MMGESALIPTCECDYEWCDRAIYAKGLCKRHYERESRWRRKGRPRPPERNTARERPSARTKIDTIMEAAKRYWEAETDDEFRRAEWAVRQAMHRYARFLFDRWLRLYGSSVQVSNPRVNSVGRFNDSENMAPQLSDGKR